VHGCVSPRSTGFIKPWSLIRRYAVQIHSTEKLIPTVDFIVDSGTQLTVVSGGARWWLAAVRTEAHRHWPPGSLKCLSTRGLVLRGRRIEGNSPWTIMCDSGDRKVARNSGLTLPSFDGSERLLLSSSSLKKRFKRSLTTSSCYLLTPMDSRDSGSMKSQPA
jgi:hypothetical protein